jgi:hypothetical protein
MQAKIALLGVANNVEQLRHCRDTTTTFLGPDAQTDAGIDDENNHQHLLKHTVGTDCLPLRLGDILITGLARPKS